MAINAWTAVGFTAGAGVGVTAERSIAIPSFGLPTWVVQFGEVVLGAGIAYAGLTLDKGEIGSVVTGIGAGYGGSALAGIFGIA